MSVADTDVIWSLRQVPLGESQLRTLGFWSKAPPSSAYYPLLLRNSLYPATGPLQKLNA